MSGYRTIHREQVSSESAPLWQVQSTTTVSSLQQQQQIHQSNGGSSWRIWTASGDGKVYSYQVQEKKVDSTKKDDELNAASMILVPTHALLGPTQTMAPMKTALGCTQVSIQRNYVGEDTAAGDYCIASMELSGRVRVWTIHQDLDKSNKSPPPPQDSESPKMEQIVSDHEFHVPSSSGTTLTICPPQLFGHGNVMVAVGCVDDGSIQLVSTGIVTPQCTKEPDPPGQILQSWGGGAVPTRMAWHPTECQLAVGRMDGAVDLYAGGTDEYSSTNNHPNGRRLHRLHHHSSPVRAVAFTPDGQILLTGSDEGMLCVWDVNRRNGPALVHHVVLAHTSWILDVTTIDKRRFVTSGADQQIHVWSLGQGYAPLHTFHCDSIPWTIHANGTNERLVIGTDHGWLQVSSLDA
mmetsp:Transcript_26899/g.41187  ORF Transcript_26899/g.41187 Transcript_26899/m.41187 type:complete len:407 (-) Transcript_26899:38-1258(-)